MPSDEQAATVYEPPQVTDHGTLVDLTAGCVGGVPEDALEGADLNEFPANSGLFCGL